MRNFDYTGMKQVITEYYNTHTPEECNKNVMYVSHWAIVNLCERVEYLESVIKLIIETITKEN